MIGGFLGAGKTTSVLKFAEYLQENEITVGIITNDQASNLGDSKIISTHGFDVEEIAGTPIGVSVARFPPQHAV